MYTFIDHWLLLQYSKWILHSWEGVFENITLKNVIINQGTAPFVNQNIINIESRKYHALKYD